MQISKSPLKPFRGFALRVSQASLGFSMISMHTIVQNSLKVGLDADEFALAIAH
ncbi:hypothetical protein [Bradyrhizobium sp. DOA1]|uniref:hypothetical protein n=1 Tax=Bradyrhizobium sp. DOA1 TaxID=1126616 RepID=UPI000B1EEA6D|nr:hypothetical protein [Bradyrhizobium sp. DOA1]